MSDEVTVESPSVESTHVEVDAKPSHEDLAISKGWKPKEEFVGNPDEFRPAKEWLERGDLLDTIHSLNRKSKEQDEAIRHLVEFNKTIEETTRKRTIEDLEAKHTAAIEVGDIDKAKLVARQMMETAQSSQPIPAQDIDPAAQQFLVRNTGWFNNDNPENAAMTAYALRRDAELMLIPGMTAEKSLAQVEMDIKKSFSHRFASPPSSAVSAPIAHTAKSKDAGLSQLPEYHQKMIKQLERSLKNFDRKSYIANVQKTLGDSK